MAEVTPFGKPRLLGTTAKPQRFKCGGAWTGCDELHEFYDLKDILVMTEAQDIQDLRKDEHWDEAKLRTALARGTVYEAKGFVMPTLLGEMWDDCSVN